MGTSRKDKRQGIEQFDELTITLPRDLYRRLKRAAKHEHCDCSVGGCTSAAGHLDSIECNVEAALEAELEELENEMVAAACQHGRQVEAELEALIETNRRGARIHLVK
jgi:hypothetical protein